MTDLEIFERVRAHLLKQGRKAESTVTNCEGGLTNECRYRGDTGMCAVGCLVSDEAYRATMEGSVVRQLELRDGKWSALSSQDDDLANALNVSRIPARDSTKQLLVELQSLHDARSVSVWGKELADMAKEFTAEGEFKP